MTSLEGGDRVEKDNAPTVRCWTADFSMGIASIGKWWWRSLMSLGDFIVYNLLKDMDKKLTQILGKVNKMSAANDLLVQEVTDLTTVVGSVVTLINGFVEQMKSAATMEEVKARVADFEVQKQALADAVAANTPAA